MRRLTSKDTIYYFCDCFPARYYYINKGQVWEVRNLGFEDSDALLETFVLGNKLNREKALEALSLIFSGAFYWIRRNGYWQSR